MTSSTVPARHRLKARGRSLTTEWKMVRSSSWHVITHPGREPLGFLLFILWCLGALLDAASTQLMMFFGYSERNPVAATGMDIVGQELYVTAATIVFLGFAFLAAARPRTPFSWTVVIVATIACLIKFWTGLANLAYWYSTTR